MSYEIGTGSLVLHYQPRVSVRDWKTACVEALVRWRTPRGGLLGPEFFIADAERSGAIVGIGRWVLETAVRQAARWVEEGRATQVAVNVSALQIDCADFAGELEGLLARYGLPPGLLEIELTESAHVADVEAAGRQFERLSDDGVTLALDDFGAGFSGIRTLSWFPANVIKIDKSLIDGIETQSVKRMLVSGIVALAQEIGATSVAEGVEDPRQLAVLCDIGCDQAQGFVFSEPVAAGRVRWDYSGMQACQNAGIRARQDHVRCTADRVRQ